MKEINQYILEKFRINSKTVIKNDMSFESFKSEIKELFDLSDDDFNHMIDCFSSDLNIDKFKKGEIKLIDKDHESYDKLSNLSADLINHPGKYKKLFSIDVLYSSVTTYTVEIDLRVFLYTMNDKSKFLLFLNYDDNKFYIFSYEEPK